MQKLVIAGGVVAVVAALAGGMYFYRMVWLPKQDLLPEFTDPPAGPRGPAVELAGFVVGKTTLPEVQQRIDAWGLRCNDTSMRALMQAKRDDIRQQMDEAKAKGEPVDGVTGASMVNYKSKKERNPQVRLACEGVLGGGLGDARADVPGRLLFVFDSPKHALRHVSWHRKIADKALAEEELLTSIERAKKKLGDAHKSVNELAQGADPFPPGRLVKRSWRYTDLEVEVAAYPFGARGVDVGEEMQVPWPVRVSSTP